MKHKVEQFVKPEPIDEYDIKVEKDEENLNDPLNKSQIKSELTFGRSSSEDLNASNNHPGQVSASGKRKLTEDDNLIFMDDGPDTFISAEVIGGDDINHSLVMIRHDHTYFLNSTQNFPSTDPLAIFTNEADSEIVTDDSIIDNERNASEKSTSNIPDIQCGLCNFKLCSNEEAKSHMTNTHSILTYEGLFFRCEFCDIFVTDRVAHMQLAHYSPLAKDFCKTSNTYQCLQCDYTSDHLTNIRNHIDAKHSSGKNNYRCEECNSEYKTLNSKRAHKSRMHTKKRKQS